MPRLAVVKKDGRRELFDRDKVAAGVYRAVEKRPVPIELIEEVIGQIEREARAWGEPEVDFKRIGELVMRSLWTI